MSVLNRFALFLIIFLLVVMAGLWISGGKREQASATLAIEAHPSQIFDYLVQPEKLKQWVEDLAHVDQPIAPRQDTLPPKLLRVYRDSSGKEREFSDEVIRYNEHDILSIISNHAGTTQVIFYQLDWDQESQQSQFTYSIQETYSGLDRFIAPLQRNPLQRRIATEAQQLKRLVEANEPKWQPNVDETTADDEDVFNTNEGVSQE